MMGFRGLAYVESGECRLVSRRYRGLKFPSLAAALAKFPAKNAILDGDIVASTSTELASLISS